MKIDHSLDFKNDKEREKFKSDVSIQEYRKSTAEALGLEIITEGVYKDYVKIPDKTFAGGFRYEKWQPDKNANLMLMVWEWWDKREGYGYIFDKIYREINNHVGIDMGNAVLLATQKAWEKWYTNKMLDDEYYNPIIDN
jgi:hypothetical protein